eukprot:TRINITY_DN12881_c0_g1_i1.p1 TRINITY_DN12881_c0_g1~~TRINITY_DN12881_c0_g1_i1.p1  ORF type:complete len:116 (+),score=34.07 TRINITY_DN12881_c0_g1_i1:2-349(+)
MLYLPHRCCFCCVFFFFFFFFFFFAFDQICIKRERERGLCDGKARGASEGQSSHLYWHDGLVHTKKSFMPASGVQFCAWKKTASLWPQRSHRRVVRGSVGSAITSCNTAIFSSTV